jgi:hypothetical protein
VTTVIDRTFSLDVPYLSVLIPLPPVDAIPPMLGFELGSGPKSSPCGFKNASSSFFRTPAPTTASCSPGTIRVVFRRLAGRASDGVERRQSELKGIEGGD